MTTEPHQWPPWRSPYDLPDPATPCLVTLRDPDGTRYIELAEYWANGHRWMLVGDDGLPGELLAWMPTPPPCDVLEK